MTEVWNVAAAYANIAGNAVVTASSAATNMPVTLLQQTDVSRRFRTGATTTVNIDFTFSSTQSADTFDFLGTNLTNAATARIKLSNTALGNTDIWDSGALTSVVDTATANPTKGPDCLLLSSTVRSGWKYARFTFTDTSLTYIEGGFFVISTRTQYSINRAYGAQRTWVDLSDKKMTQGGQSIVRPRPKFRRWDFQMDFLSATERWALVDLMDITNGTATPVLFIMDPSSTNLGRDSIFGLLSELSPVPEIQAFGSDGLSMFSRSYKIEERL